MVQIFNEDCLDGMNRIPDGSVDMILADLPFGISACDFDRRIPFDAMWEHFNRVTKFNAAIALFANGKFLIELAASNLKNYRYKWCWVKNVATGFLNAKRMPLKTHEDVLIFYRQTPTYNPQFKQGEPYKVLCTTRSPNYKATANNQEARLIINDDGKRYPLDVQNFKTTNSIKHKNHHPQQKPVDLLEYLIRTYTNENETVLDVTMGSGSTGVACVNTNRNFIGFELDKNFFDIAQERIANKEIEYAEAL